MNSTKSLFKRIVGFSMVSVISALLSVIVAPLSTHFYNPAELGRINFFYSAIAVAYTLFCLGLDQGYVRFYSLVDDDNDRRSLLTFNLLACLGAVFVATALALLFEDDLSLWLFGSPNCPAAVWSCAILTCLVLCRFISLYYRMNNNILNYTIFAGTVSVVQKGLYIVAAPFSRDYFFSLSVVTSICVAISLVVLILQKNDFNSIRYSKLVPLYRDEVKFSIPLLLAGVLVLLSNYTPQFVIRSTIGYEGVSIYTAALTVSLAIQLIQSGFNTFWSPYVYENYHNSDEQCRIQGIHEVVVSVSVFACGVLAILSDQIFLIFDSQYSEGATLVPFLMLGPMCYTIGGTTGIGLTLKMKSGISAVISIIGLAVNFFLCFMLVPSFGLCGAAVAVGLSGLATLSLKTVFGYQYYKSFNSWTYMAKGLVCYCGICVASIVLFNYPIAKLIVQIMLLALTVALMGPNKLLSFVKRIQCLLSR